MNNTKENLMALKRHLQITYLDQLFADMTAIEKGKEVDLSKYDIKITILGKEFTLDHGAELHNSLTALVDNELNDL